jgi:outer membrane protein OmpA-like peptidoglycan-associated protein
MNSVTGKRLGRGPGILLPLILIIVPIVGCGPSKMAKDQLEQARKTYAQAKADRNVEAFAPIYLSDAGEALQKAERTGNSEEMLHLGYLAEKKAQIAMTVAEGRMAEEDFEKLNTETARTIAMKREQEAKKAMMEAEQSRLAALAEGERAAKARMEAEKAQMEAEQASLAAKVEAERAAKAKAEADMLMKELSELKARQTERGIVLTIGEVLFAFAKADLSSKADRSVNKLAEFLEKYQNRNVLIEGHTDNVGSDEYNQGLSQRRAQSVKDKLVSDGVDPDRITTVGYGEKYPAVSNDTEVNRSLNRRVEVIILNEGVSAETQLRE